MNYVTNNFLSLNFELADANAIAGKTQTDIHKLLVYRKKNRGSVTHIADRLGNPEPIEGDWLVLTPKDKMPQPDKVAFPKPPKAADGSLMYERIPNKGDLDINKAVALTITPSATPVKRRHAEDVNGIVENSKCSLTMRLNIADAVPFLSQNRQFEQWTASETTK